MSKQIYIGLSSPKKDNIYSKAIRKVLGTKYSHCYVRWPTSWGFDAIYEASGFSVKFVGGDIWHSRNDILREWSIDISTKTYHSKFLPYLMGLSGLKYGLRQAFGIWLSTIFNLKTNPFGDKEKRMICSEIIFYILTEVFEKKWEISPDIVTPKDLERFMDGVTQE